MNRNETNSGNNITKLIDHDKSKYILGEYYRTLQSAKLFFKSNQFQEAKYLFENSLFHAKNLNDKSKKIQSLHLISNALYKLNKYQDNLNNLNLILELVNSSFISNEETYLLKIKIKTLAKLFITFFIINNTIKMSQTIIEIFENFIKRETLDDKLTVLSTLIKILFDQDFSNYLNLDKLIKEVLQEIENFRLGIVLHDDNFIDADLKKLLLNLFSKNNFTKFRNYLNDKFYELKYYQNYPKYKNDLKNIILIFNKNNDIFKKLKTEKLKMNLESIFRVNKINFDFKLISTTLEIFFCEWRMRVNYFDDLVDDYFLKILDRFIFICENKNSNINNKEIKVLPIIKESVNGVSSLLKKEVIIFSKTGINNYNNSNINNNNRLINVTRITSRTKSNFNQNFKNNNKISKMNQSAQLNLKEIFKNKIISDLNNKLNDKFVSNKNESNCISKVIIIKDENNKEETQKLKMPIRKSQNSLILQNNIKSKLLLPSEGIKETKLHNYSAVKTSPTKEKDTKINKSKQGKQILKLNLQQNKPKNISIKQNIDDSLSGSTLTPSPKLLNNILNIDFKIESPIRKKARKRYQNIFNKILESYKNLENKLFDWFFDPKIPNYITQYNHITKNGKTSNNIDKTNQDNFFIYENFLLFKNFYFFGVCDGHGPNGHLASEHAKFYIPANLQLIEIEKSIHNNNKINLDNLNDEIEDSSDFARHNIIKSIYDYLKINTQTFSFWKHSFKQIFANISESFETTHDDLKMRKFDYFYSGTTLCSVFIFGRSLFCANVGDSRAVIGCKENGKIMAIALSQDHKPNSSGEKERIINSNGRVEPYRNDMDVEMGPARVWLQSVNSPGLAMSRSIGDGIASRIGVISTPEILDYTLTKNDKFIIIASDGIWEFISSQNAVDIVTPHYYKNNSEDACKDLLENASKFWKINENVIDDITCIVMFLDVN